MTKICSKCKREKDLKEFSKDKSKRDGRRPDCKKCCADYKKVNKDKICQYSKEYYKANREEISQQNKVYYKANKDKIDRCQREYKKANKDKYSSYAAKRRARKLNATPHWLTKEDWDLIEDHYILAQTLTEFTGIPHEVDHIIPLQGKNISGLHVPDNLQVVSRSKNRSKSNKY